MLRDKIKTLVLAAVIFFSMLPMFCTPAKATTTYEYLIITSTQLSDEFQILADWKAKWVDGAMVETVNSTATDVEIKDIISNYSTNYGTKFVLLGGDVDVIPAHMMVPDGYNYSIAEDWWFANLNGNENISDYEVYIGRAPVDNETETMNFVKKVISYEQMAKPKGNLFHQSRIHQYNDPNSTVLPHDCIQIAGGYYPNYTLFEEDFILENETLGKDDWINFWNNDAIMSLHTGHGEPSYYWLSGRHIGEDVLWNVTDVQSLNNTFWPLHTTVACRVGNFTEDDCLAEAYVKDPDNGAIACFANYAKGLGMRADAAGYPGFFVREQFKALYEWPYPPDRQHIGAILANSKKELIVNATEGDAMVPWAFTWREINLIGDPETPVLTKRESPPETPSPPVGPAIGYVYTDVEFNASTIDNESDDIYYEFNWGDSTTTTVGPYSSGENATASHQWTYPIQYNVTVRAKDVYGAHRSWSNSTTITLGQNDADLGQDAGNTFNDASSISPSAYKGTLYDPSDDDDYFKVSVQNGQTLAVCMTPPENTNFDLEVYNASGQFIAGSYNGNGTQDCVTIYNADSGDWRIRIFLMGGEGQCSFVVSVYLPGGGCPFVYVWNGTEFVIDNNLVTGSAKSNGTEVEDYYRLEQDLVPLYEGYFNSYYSLKISEFQEEHSYFDQVQLFAVDHQANVSVAASSTGEFLTYQDPYPPITAVDEANVSWLAELSEIDGEYYEGYNGSFLILNFGEVTGQDAKLVFQTDPPPPGDTKTSIYIQVLNSSESWVDVVSIIPRTYWATDIIDLSDYLPSDGELVVRFYFTFNHRVGFVGLDTTPQAEIDVEDANLLLAYHSEEGFVTAELCSDDDVYAELVADQQITLLFRAPNPDEEARTFIFYVKGYYTITG